MEILEWPLCKYKSSPFPLLNDAGYLKRSNSEACAKKLSQILANNIDNGRIYVRYCRLRSTISSVPFGISINLDKSFGSKRLIKHLSKLSLSISGDEVLRFRQSAFDISNAYQ